MLQSQGEMMSQLEGLRNGHHVEKAEQWAQETMERHPNLTTVSVNLGVSFGLSFSVTLIFTRPHRRRGEGDDTSNPLVVIE